MSDSILVRVTLDAYDFANPSQKQTQVFVQIPEVARVSYMLPAATFHPLKDRAWPEVLDVAQEHYAQSWVVDPSSAVGRQAVMEWLRDPTNRDEMQAAYELDQARRSPITRRLLEENGRLLDRVTELEAQREALAERLRAGQRWEQGRTPELVSENFVSQSELRSIFGIPLVAPWVDDPCRPCGCPKRFDRHAWGCPTLPAEGDGTGFFQPGHAYTHRPGPDTTGGPRVRFYCETVTTDRDTGQPVARGWGGRRYGDRWTSVQHTRGLEDWQSGAWVDTTDGEREPAAPLTVFRASHDSIVMGLYTTAAEARKHCEAEERRAWAKHSAPTNFDWIEDEEDGVAEMTAWVGGEERTTGYVVTALEVAAAYDEEADQ